MQSISRGIKARPRTAGNGGTSAPAGHGIYGNHPVRPAAPKQWSPKGESKGTEYARSLKSQAPGGQGSPNPVAPVSPAGSPWDSAYELAGAGARTRYANALNALGYNRTATQQDYGLDPGFNDYQSNPYSRAALLEQTFQRANRGSATSMGAAGHLYSGSLQNQLGYNRTNRDQEDNALRSAYASALQEIKNKELEAGDDLSESLSDAAWKRVEGAESQPLDPSTIAPKPKPQKAKTGGKFKFYASPGQLPMNKKKGKK